MFKPKTKVESCPYTRKSHGVVRMSPSLIAQLASAVSDPDEWAIVLQGTREQRGYEVIVTGYRVPPQTRSCGHVELPEMDLEDDDIGVIHSHHKLGAFFSGTDKTQLNPRFPVSIVVAQKKLQYLGFDYLGTGKVTLPCGSPAEVEFFIQPTEGPVVHEAVEVVHGADDLGHCPNYTDTAQDAYHVHYLAACGLEEAEVLRAEAFGSEPALLDIVKLLPRPQLTLEQWNKSGSESLAGKVSAKKPASNEGWFQSLIPNSLRPRTQPLVSTGDDICLDCRCDKAFCYCVKQLYKCEVCGKHDEFDGWECGNCGEGEYCMACEVGHDRKFDCKRVC